MKEEMIMNLKKGIMIAMALLILVVGFVKGTLNAAEVDEFLEPEIQEEYIDDTSSYASFEWKKTGTTYVYAKLTAKSGTRYGQVSIYCYDGLGRPVVSTRLLNEKVLYGNSSIASEKYVSTSGNIPSDSDDTYHFYGHLYQNANYYGEPIVSYEKYI